MLPPKQPSLRTLHFDSLLFPTSLEATILLSEEGDDAKKAALSSATDAKNIAKEEEDPQKRRSSNVTVVKTETNQVIFEV